MNKERKGDSIHMVVRLLSLPSFMVLISLMMHSTVLAQTATPSPWIFNGTNITNTNTGNIGIGTAAPGTLLEVNKSQNAGTLITVDNSYTSAGNSAYTGFFFKQGGINRFFFGSINDNNAAQYGGPGAVQLWNYANGPMIFATNSSERLRIDSNGNVGIGTTNPAGQLEVKSGINSHNSLFLNTTTAGFADSLVFQEAGTIKASIQVNPSILQGGLLFNTNGGASPANTRLVIDASGNVGIGTISPTKRLDVAGDLNASGTITGGIIQAKYQDVAEWVRSKQQLTPGTVVILDSEKTNQVIASTQSYDTKVAGVVSDSPGVILGEAGADKVKVATTGRVKVRVDATRSPIKIGDLLVTSDEEGVAMKSEPINFQGRQMHVPGTIIGKALESLPSGKGEIMVLLSLQ